jgi:N4-gp56 family major capsid protein
MASQATTTANVDPAVSLFYDKILLDRALPKLVYDIAGQQRNLRQKSGNTIKFRRYNSLPLANVPLPEGQPPPLNQLSKTDLLAQIQQFAGAVAITDVVKYTVEDDTLQETTQLQGEQMGLTLDSLLRDVLCASASYRSCTMGTNGKTPTELNQVDIDNAVQILLGGNAEFLEEVKQASTGIGTMPIAPAFIGIGHTDELTTLKNCTDWVPAHKYPKADPMHKAELGSTGYVRWLLTTNAKIVGTGPKVYNNLIIGRNAYGVIELDDGTVQNIFHDFGSAGPMDPVDQLASMGWKTWFVARILNDAFILIQAATNKAGT